MFEKITPEQAGVSSFAVAEFIRNLNKRGMQMHSLLMMKGDKLFAEYYWAPFNKSFTHRMYSQTKSYTSVAIGLLEEEGKLSLDDPISKYFPEKLDTPLHSHLANQTIRQMLTMTTVGEPDIWFKTDYDDRTRMYFNHNRDGELRYPGTIWEYDSAGSQVLSSLVEKLSGMSTFDYLNEKIFRHLGTFKTARMLRTRNGDSWGDSALLCTARDMVSFARFVMNYGTWNGERLMNEQYLRDATAKQKDNIECEHPVYQHGYGYQIWRTEQNGFAFNGMGSQYTVCLPDKDIIFSCTADTQGHTHAADLILGYFFDLIAENMDSEALPEDPEAQEYLDEQTSDLKLYAIQGAPDSSMRPILNGREYVCDENPMGIESFSFSFSEDGSTGELVYVNAQGEKHLPFGINHNVFCKFPELGYSNELGGVRTTDGFTYVAAVSAAWRQEDKLVLDVQIIDKYFGNGLFIFAFNGDKATVRMKKVAEDFMQTYVGDANAHVKKSDE
ncbi:MAG: serine hydrolase [Clostridia bacterium]|nr:serine hydrolase [Clostridia bacterium]